jgi:hypothetical protein
MNQIVINGLESLSNVKTRDDVKKIFDGADGRIIYEFIERLAIFGEDGFDENKVKELEEEAIIGLSEVVDAITNNVDETNVLGKLNTEVGECKMMAILLSSNIDSVEEGGSVDLEEILIESGYILALVGVKNLIPK